MDRETPVPDVGKRLFSASLDQKAATAINSSPARAVTEAIAANDRPRQSGKLMQPAQLFEQVDQLEAEAKLALLHTLIADLNADQIQSLLEFGQRQLAERQHHSAESAVSVSRTTRLLLKKDYTYQDRGLNEPTQYYVYLRRCKPKLDRYIGTLFYIPQGCTLAYSRDAEGRILFNPPHNIFQLKDAKNHFASQVVRLICLEPPPPQYTFTKQQDDVPEIHLRLEYLDPVTLQSKAEASYAFPFCMYEGGKLDRYRWEVSTIIPAEVSAATLPTETLVAGHGLSDQLSAASNQSALSQTSFADATLDVAKISAATSPRRIIELQSKSSTFYLASSGNSAAVLERMRLWVAWSETAMPQSTWEVVHTEAGYLLRNATSQRKILSFFPETASITLESSLPVLMKWFQDLSLAVSQTQNQRQYSSAQLKLARSLFVDMSLPLADPAVVLKKLFGVKFVKTPANS